MILAARVLAGLWLAIVPAAAHAAEHVIQISVDGLSGILLQGPPGVTLHGAGYIASTFDAAHDRGRSNALYASKSKFVLFEQSFDGAKLALGAFGLPAMPGSSIDAAQDLRLGPAPQIPIFPPLDGRAVSAAP